MTAPNLIPEIKITPPDGELLYVNPYIGEKVNMDEHGNLQITHGYLRADWDGVYDQSYPPTYDVKEKADCSNLVYKGAYPLYNVTGGILYNDKVGVECENCVGIEDSIDTSTEPSNLKNTKSNIRKIKPDINSELKRI